MGTLQKNNERIGQDFFTRDVLEVCPDILGCRIVRKIAGQELQKFIITEVEAYRGGDDLACHASRGRTPRTGIMFHEGGFIYMYLVYGMHWMLNIVTGKENDPQALLVRGIKGFNGPGRVSKILDLDKGFYGEDLARSKRIWIEAGTPLSYQTLPRVGIDYAGEPWVSKPWRFLATGR